MERLGSRSPTFVGLGFWAHLSGRESSRGWPNITFLFVAEVVFLTVSMQLRFLSARVK